MTHQFFFHLMNAFLPTNQITIASTAAEVVRSCEYTFCMLSTMEASVAVVSTASSENSFAGECLAQARYGLSSFLF